MPLPASLINITASEANKKKNLKKIGKVLEIQEICFFKFEFFFEFLCLRLLIFFIASVKNYNMYTYIIYSSELVQKNLKVFRKTEMLEDNLVEIFFFLIIIQLSRWDTL